MSDLCLAMIWYVMMECYGIHINFFNTRITLKLSKKCFIIYVISCICCSQMYYQLFKTHVFFCLKGTCSAGVNKLNDPGE